MTDEYPALWARAFYRAGPEGEAGWYYRFEDETDEIGPFALAVDAGHHCRNEMIRRRKGWNDARRV